MQQRYEIYRHGTIELVIREEDEEGMGVNVLHVDVYYTSQFGGPAKAEVNWSAIGSTTPEVAVEYAAMITRAAQLADAMNHGSWTSEVVLVKRLAVLSQGERIARKVDSF